MKKISKLLLLPLFVSAIFASSIPKNENVVNVEAAPITQGTKLYLAPNANWRDANARFAAHFFGDGTTWLSMTQTEGNPLYYEVIMNQAKSFTNVIFCRMNPSTIENNWDNKWDQTNDLVYNGTDNLYTIAEGVWSKGDGSWSTYVEEVLPPLPVFTPTVAGITSSKVRIWLDRSEEYDSGYTITMKVGATYYLPTDYEAAIHEGRWFVYYDMPTAVLSGSPNIDLVVYLTDVMEVKVISAGIYATGDNNKVWKINKSEETYSLSKGAISDRIVPTFFAKVLEGYLTCSSSAENGYNAFPLIDSNFLPRDGEGHWNLEGNLDSNMITDYSGIGASGYGVDRGTGVQVDAYAKYVALQNMYDSNNGGLGVNLIAQNQNSSSKLIITILSFISLSALLVLVFKKKSYNGLTFK